jgi:hypothetical protein
VRGRARTRAQQQLNYVATDTSIPTLQNATHHIVVTTTSSGIAVTMDGAQVLDYATTLPPEVLLGFTSATGGLNGIHQVQNVAITTGQPGGPKARPRSITAWSTCR